MGIRILTLIILWLLRIIADGVIYLWEMSVKLTLDQKTCIGCGMCVGISDELFEMDYEKNKAIIRKGADLTKRGNLEKAKEAVRMCPVEIIKLT